MVVEVGEQVPVLLEPLLQPGMLVGIKVDVIDGHALCLAHGPHGTREPGRLARFCTGGRAGSADLAVARREPEHRSARCDGEVLILSCYAYHITDAFRLGATQRR